MCLFMMMSPVVISKANISIHKLTVVMCIFSSNKYDDVMKSHLSSIKLDDQKRDAAMIG